MQQRERTRREKASTERAAAVAPVVKTKNSLSKSELKADKLLTKLRDNPQGDWEVGDLEKIANLLGVRFSPPSHGSHYKVSSDGVPGILTVPAKKPIKAPYVRQFVAFCRAHMAYVKDNR